MKVVSDFEMNTDYEPNQTNPAKAPSSIYEPQAQFYQLQQDVQMKQSSFIMQRQLETFGDRGNSYISDFNNFNFTTNNAQNGDEGEDSDLGSR